MSTTVNSTAKKETPLAKNTQPGPKNPNSTPPKAGPTARVAWNWVELRVTAFNSSVDQPPSDPTPAGYWATSRR